MKFCARCGKTVAILDSNAGSLCPQCTVSGRRAPEESATDLDDDLRQSSLFVRDGRLQLVSREGWLLWSGSAVQPHTLEQITTQASRILKIRKRRKA